jgi:hypothetical protein
MHEDSIRYCARNPPSCIDSSHGAWERVRCQPIAVRDPVAGTGYVQQTGLNQPSDQRFGARSRNELTAVPEASRAVRRGRARLKTPGWVSRVKDPGPKRPHATKAAMAR